MKGIPYHTLSQGRLVWVDADFRAERGMGKYVKRQVFSQAFNTTQTFADKNKTSAVKQ